MNFQATNHLIFRKKLPLLLEEGWGEVNANNNPINYVDLYGLWFDNAKPAPEGGGSGGAGAEPFDWAGAWNTYQLIYGDNGGYSGSGTRGINMSSPTGDTFASHGAGISGYGYSKVRSNGGNSSSATSFMAQPPDGGDPPGFNPQSGTWIVSSGENIYQIAGVLQDQYGLGSEYDNRFDYGQMIMIKNGLGEIGARRLPTGYTLNLPNGDNGFVQVPAQRITYSLIHNSWMQLSPTRSADVKFGTTIIIDVGTKYAPANYVQIEGRLLSDIYGDFIFMGSEYVSSHELKYVSPNSPQAKTQNFNEFSTEFFYYYNGFTGRSYDYSHTYTNTNAYGVIHKYPLLVRFIDTYY